MEKATSTVWKILLIKLMNIFTSARKLANITMNPFKDLLDGVRVLMPVWKLFEW